MGKLRTAVLILIVVGVLAAAACMPQMVTALMDWGRLGSVSFMDVQPVKLEFGENMAPNSENGAEYILDRLGLEASMSSVPITEDDTAMTRQEVEAAVQKKMQAYADAGIFEWFDYSDAHATPYLGIDPKAPDTFTIFWTVSMVQEQDPYRSLFLHVDDGTGAIVSIRYECYGAYDKNAYIEKSPVIMDKLVQIFLGQLGLTENMRVEVQPEETVRGELDGGVLFTRYRIISDGREDVYVDFYVTGPGGFSTYFPTEAAVRSQGW